MNSKREQEAGITLDFKRITLGNLISLAVGLAAIVGSYYSLKAEVLSAREEIAIVRNDIAWIKASLGGDRGSLAKRTP